MKKIIAFLFLLSLLVSNTCFSQSGWFWSYPYPTGNHLHSVEIVNPTTYFVVGRYGTFLKTTNNGQNWQYQINYSTDELNCIQFVDQNTGYVAGTDWSSPSKGVIYKTTNLGVNWFRYVAADAYDIKCMKFLNVNSGYSSGAGLDGSVLKTVNGGINWSVKPTGNSFTALSMIFININTGYLAGEHIVIKTTNGGDNWSEVYNSSLHNITSMSFSDSISGIINGYQQIYPFTIPFVLVTTDGGNSWSSHSISAIFNSIFFLNQFTGYACGSSIMKSTNKGNTWFIQFQEPGYSGFYGINFTDSLLGITVGINGEILRTGNSGINWIAITPTPVGEYVTRIKFLDQFTGFAVTDHFLLKTTNSASEWDTIRLNNTILFDDLTLMDSTLYVCGQVGTILKSTNLGVNWITQSAGSGNLLSIFFVDNVTGFCSNSSTVYKTTNGGDNWINLNVTGLFKSIFFVNENTGFAVGYTSGFKTTNGGISWFTLPPNSINGVTSVYFINESTGFTTNYQFQVKKSTNCGETWNTITDYGANSAYCNAIHFINQRTGYAVGYYGRVIKTTNTGDNWSQVYFPTDKNLYTVFMLDTNICYIGGGHDCIILKTTTGGSPINISNMRSVTPTFFSLSQNYPNPFNPVTRIKYDVPKSSLVNIIIYDVLGREIETLVSQAQKPGSYEVTWDGSRYASGVYFYKLMTGEFIETRKMVLIK